VDRVPASPLSWLSLLLPLSLLALAGCEPPMEPPPAKPRVQEQQEAPAKKPEQVAFPPAAYPLHLSLADLTLEAGDDPSSAAADFDIARAYSSQPQERKTLQPAVIIEYSLRDSAARRFVVAPFYMPKEDADFPSLEDIMTRMSSLSYTVYDLRVGVISIPALSPLPPEGNDRDAAKKLAEDSLAPLIKSAAPLPPMGQARVYLQLARFFTSNKYKEPAYLAIEEARQSLALVNESATADKTESGRNLTREIDTQEALLHKTMPFTLNF